jgi:hypothetical protein
MKLCCFFTDSFYLARLKKSLSDTGIFIANKRIDHVSKSVTWNEHQPLYVIFSIDTTTKQALLKVRQLFLAVIKILAKVFPLSHSRLIHVTSIALLAQCG